MRLRQQSIQNLIQAINLQEHLKRFMEVKRSGNNAIAKCPFHQDTTPSLYIYDYNYHCFACKAHGTVIDYEMFRTGFSFREVIENLAQSYQLPLEYEESIEGGKKNFQTTFFERENKLLEKMQSFFKENLSLFFENNNLNLPEEYIHFLKNNFIKLIDFYYTGDKKICDEFINSQNNEEIFSYDLSERIVFPLYKENGRLGGFAFSDKILKKLDWNSNSKFSVYKIFSIFTNLKVFSPFPKSTLNCINLVKMRSNLQHQNEIIVTSSIEELYFLLVNGQLNTIVSLNNEVELYLAKFLSKKVPKITIAISNIHQKKFFLWKTFLNVIQVNDFAVEYIALPHKLDQILEEEIKKLLLQSIPIWDEITRKIFENVPKSKHLEEFKRKLLPIFNRIEDKSRRKLILSLLSNKYFGSSKNIFFSSNIDYNKHSANDSVYIENKKNELVSLDKKNEALNLKSDNKIKINFIEKTIKFYHKILLSDYSMAIEARLYLEKRGISVEHIRKWQLGYAPVTNELSIKVAQNLVPAIPLLELGLIKKSKMNDEYYDFFHDRITIPILGHDGEPVALSGRLFVKNTIRKDRELPKYINSQESVLFSKSSILYHFYNALQSIIQYGYVLVVEGYMDCISLVNSGITNVVAVMGTSLTSSHIETLSKVTKRIIICFDSDNAGKNATKRSFFLSYHCLDIELEYLAIPEGKDPDDFIRKYGVDVFRELIPNSCSLLSQVCAWLLEESNFKTELFLRLVKEHVLPTILKHPKKEVQEEALSFLCEKYFPNLYPSDLRKEGEGLSLIQSKNFITKDFIKSDVFSIEEWPVCSIIEVKLLLSLVHSRFCELPIRLRNVVLGLSSEEEIDEKFCALAVSNQMSKISFSVYLELLSFMAENTNTALVEVEELENLGFSHNAKLVIAYASSNVHVLYQYKMEELLKENLLASVSMVSFKNIWDLKNSGCLRFQLRNIKLSSKMGFLPAFIAEALLHLELEYIDNALKTFSSSHFDHEINEQFHSLARERTRRQKKYGSFESFNLH